MNVHTLFPFSVHQIVAKLGGQVTGPDKCSVPGPGHSAKDTSLSITIAPTAPDGFIVYSHAGDDDIECKDWVREKLGLPRWTAQRKAEKASKVVQEYIYRQADGTAYLKVCRTSDKGFFQLHWNGRGWDKGAPKGPKIPFRLPELLKAEHDDAFIVEGEKDCNNLAMHGFTATTNSCGAGKWTSDLNCYFAGKNVYILPDNDDIGAEHARSVAANLLPIAREIRIINLPGLQPKGDVSDWLAAGGTADELMDLARQAKPIGAEELADQSEPEAAAADGRQEVRQPSAKLSNDILTEDNAAQQFVELHGDHLRYCHTRAAWFHWNGAYWKQDGTGRAFHWARELARRLAEDQDNKTRYIASKTNFAAGVERFAKHDIAVAVTSEYWDRDPWLLGTPGGTVDLRTGMLRPSSPGDGITKTTAVTPDNTGCPLWLKFLNEATGEDKGLIRFLQQWCGYCLTGITNEHALLFVYGDGGNGKSVYLIIFTSILKDYAATSAMETFTASNNDKHPTDLAMLCGARLVTASETEAGKAWAEARIKQMTGGDPISARFMRQDFFTYMPQFKLTIIGNHKPTLTNVDAAARRRFNIVPFTRKPATPDRKLGEKLMAEAPAILQWMIEGCLDWQKNGLVRPPCVTEATEEYFSDQEVFPRWLEEECITHPGSTISEASSVLYRSWSDYARSLGAKPGTQADFKESMRRAGFTYRQKNTAREFCGIQLKPKRGPDEATDEAAKGAPAEGAPAVARAPWE
ncbi:phage/plasmid primase, P4 family [Bradyrhizobium sp. 173]|uniref:phage/plasmid primase, P4 family n=1 Tax=unclassified Bradyrhizobium TaxID=2631580 RepID=UPI003208CD0F